MGAVVLMLMACLSSFAVDNFKWGDFNFTVTDEENKYCAISSVAEPEKETLQVYGEKVFCNGNGKYYTVKGVAKEALSDLGNVTKIDLSMATSMDYIGEMAFAINDNLREVVLPSSLRIIGFGAFMYNPSLVKVKMPEGLIEVGGESFLGCEMLRNFYIPSSVTTVGGYVFELCLNLQRITFGGHLPPNNTDDNAFANIGAETFCYVPDVSDIPNFKVHPAFQFFEGRFRGSDIGEAFNLGLFSFVINDMDGSGTPGALIVGPNYDDDRRAFTEEELCSGYVDFLGGDFPVYGIRPGAFDSDEYTDVLDFANPLFSRITTIPERAFANCHADEIRFYWDRLTEIGEAAFINSNVREFVISGSTGIIHKNAFHGCPVLERIRSNGMYYSQDLQFQDQCFAQCPLLKTVEVSSAVKLIGSRAFAEATSLQRFTIDRAEPLSIPDDVFEGANAEATLRVPSGSEEFYRYAVGWNYFTKINSSDIGAQFEDDVFRYEIGEVMGNPSAVIIGVNSDCTDRVLKLHRRYVEYEGSEFPVEMIGAMAFFGNEQIEEIDCTVLERNEDDDEYYWWRMDIGDMAFAECPNLRQFKCDVTRNVGEQAFAKSGLTSINLPHLEYSIGEQAFYECQELTSVILGGDYNLTLSNQAFANCPKLKDIDMANLYGMTMNKVFYGDAALTSIVLPANLMIYGTQTFLMCKNLRKVESLNTNPDDIDKETFLGIPADAKLIVPAGTVDLYKSKTGWNQFGENIIDISSIPTGIEEIHSWSEERGVRSGWYTLDGQRLNTQPTKRGVYLHNGRKIINIGR